MKAPRRFAAVAPKKKRKPKEPLPPRITGEVVFPFFRRVEGMRTVSALNTSEHFWTTRDRKKVEAALVWAALGLCPQAIPRPVVVTLTRVAPGWIDPTDNLPSGFKRTIDMVAHWLGLDDGKAVKAGLLVWRIEQRASAPGVYHVEIDIRAGNAPRRSALDVLADWQARGCPPAATAPSPDEVF